MDTDIIIKQARENGLCDEWFSDFLKNRNLSHLCEKFFKGSDWALENDFPTLDLLRKFKPEQFGLHTDFIGKIKLDSTFNQKAFFGNSKAFLKVDGFSVNEIYIRHNTELSIELHGNSKVFLTILDDAKANIMVNDHATVEVFSYGGEKENVNAVLFDKTSYTFHAKTFEK